jgi:replicative DNA helicase
MIFHSTSHISEFFKNPKKALPTVDSGFNPVNLIGGYPLGAVTLVAGYPGMGVSAFMISSMINMAKGNKPCTYFSIKNSVFNILRMAASNFLEREGLSSNHFLATVKDSSLISLPIHFCDNSNLTVDEIDFILAMDEHIAANNSDHKKPHAIFIDDLNSIRSQEAKNSKDKLSEVCSGLAGLAQKLHIAIILGYSFDKDDTVLRREIEDVRPDLSLLRNKGEIEQHCAKVLFLHRPEYFKITLTEDNMPTQGLMEVLVAKNNTGLTGSIKMKFIGKYHRVEAFGDENYATPFNQFA